MKYVFVLFFFWYSTFLITYPRIQLKCHLCSLKFIEVRWMLLKGANKCFSKSEQNLLWPRLDTTAHLLLRWCRDAPLAAAGSCRLSLSSRDSPHLLIFCTTFNIQTTNLFNLSGKMLIYILFWPTLQYDNTHTHIHTPAECIKYGLTGGFWMSPPQRQKKIK